MCLDGSSWFVLWLTFFCLVLMCIDQPPELMMPLITSLLEQVLHKYGISNVMQALMLIHIHAGANKTIADAVTLLQNGASGDVAPAEDIKALVAKLEEEAG